VGGVFLSPKIQYQFIVNELLVMNVNNINIDWL